MNNLVNFKSQRPCGYITKQKRTEKTFLRFTLCVKILNAEVKNNTSYKTPK